MKNGRKLNGVYCPKCGSEVRYEEEWTWCSSSDCDYTKDISKINGCNNIIKITLYDSVYLSEFINTPFNLYGSNCNSFSQWIPIEYKDAKNYDIVLERSILQYDRFVIVKLGKDMREDLK